MTTQDTTPEKLRHLITKTLHQRGYPPEYIAGYLDAQNLAGWTRPHCPAWIRASAAAHYTLTPAGITRTPTPEPTTTKNQKS